MCRGWGRVAHQRSGLGLIRGAGERARLWLFGGRLTCISFLSMGVVLQRAIRSSCGRCT